MKVSRGQWGIVRSGVTRRVILVGRWAVKVPAPGRLVRGWLGNQSEWRQRHRSDVEPPRATLCHVVVVYRRAIEIGTWDPDNDLWSSAASDDCRDELKGSSWGLYPEGWRLIDFDRAWVPGTRSMVGKLYYGRQERLARKWSKWSR